MNIQKITQIMIFLPPPSVDMVFFAFVLLEIPTSAKGQVALLIDYLEVAHKPLEVLGKKLNI